VKAKKWTKIEKENQNRGKVDQNREKVDQNCHGIHMTSRDYLLHTIFWNPEYKNLNKD